MRETVRRINEVTALRIRFSLPTVRRSQAGPGEWGFTGVLRAALPFLMRRASLLGSPALSCG